MKEYSENDSYNLFRFLSAFVFLAFMFVSYFIKKKKHAYSHSTCIFFDWLMTFIIASCIICLPLSLIGGTLSPDDLYEIEWIAVFCLSHSLAISFFVLSYKITSGISWFIALVAYGVLLYALVKGASFIITYSNQYIIVLMILLTVITLLVRIFIKIQNKINRKQNKGNSYMYMNIFIWHIPYILPLCLFACLSLFKVRFSPEGLFLIFWINLLATFIVIWFLADFIKRWKELPEED